MIIIIIKIKKDYSDLQHPTQIAKHIPPIDWEMPISKRFKTMMRTERFLSYNGF